MLGQFEHGGDTYGLGDVIDFSVNLNPLGTPVQIVRAVKVAASDISSYPDPLCRDLVDALAEREGVPADRIVATAGATDAFTRIVAALKPSTALICAPCYSGYEQALRQIDLRIVHHSLVESDNFDVTERILDYISPDVDLMFLCSPNNPTGRVIPRELLCDILDAASRCGTWVVLDESFLGFTAEQSAVPLMAQYPRLIVVSSFTKTYATAGMRIGWCVFGSADAATRVREAGMPWIVSTLAQVAAKAALEIPDYMVQTRTYVDAERDHLQAGLREAGLRVIPSHANYILFQSPKPLYEPMLERGIMIRRCENYRGLDSSWFRVAVRTTEENKLLLESLKQIL